MSPTLRVKMQQYWQERTPRERQVLQIWLAVVGCALVYFAAFAPLNAAISRLETAVPRLENQLMKLRGSEIAVPKPAAGQQDLRSAAFAALGAKQISAELRSITPTQVELRANLASVSDALNLAHSLRNELAAQVSEIQIKTDAQGVALLIVLERV